MTFAACSPFFTATDLIQRDDNNLDAHKLLGRIYLRSLGQSQDQGPSSQPSPGNQVLDLAIAEFLKIVALEPKSLEDRLLLGVAEQWPSERDRLAHGVGRGSMPRSSDSTSASQEAAITFSDTPIVPQTSLPSEASIRTRVTAAVPFASSTMRTL